MWDCRHVVNRDRVTRVASSIGSTLQYTTLLWIHLHLCMLCPEFDTLAHGTSQMLYPRLSLTSKPVYHPKNDLPINSVSPQCKCPGHSASAGPIGFGFKTLDCGTFTYRRTGHRSARGLQAAGTAIERCDVAASLRSSSVLAASPGEVEQRGWAESRAESCFV